MTVAPGQNPPPGLLDLARPFAGTAPGGLKRLNGGPAPVSCDVAEVFALGRAVVKVHWSGTDPDRLAARLQVTGEAVLREVLLRPLHPEPLPLGDRWVTVWPLARTLPQTAGPQEVPWADTGRLLAQLHTYCPADPAGLPPSGQIERIERAVDRLVAVCGAAPGQARPRPVQIVLAAWERVRALPPASVRALAHGDWHFGQLVRPWGEGQDPLSQQDSTSLQNQPSTGGWRLIDIDDLGWGDPTWDLGRAAAFYALGVVPEVSWTALVESYRACGGPALPDGDLWCQVDRGARAHVVHSAARSLVRHRVTGAEPDDLDRELLGACERMLVD